MSEKLKKAIFDDVVKTDQYLEMCKSDEHLITAQGELIGKQNDKIIDLQAQLAKLQWVKITPETMPEIPIRIKVWTARMNREPIELEDGFNCPCTVAHMCEDEKWYADGNMSGEYKPTHYKLIILPDKEKSDGI